MTKFFKPFSAGVLATIFVLGLLFSEVFASTSKQTDVDRAQHITDDRGVPLLEIGGLGKVNHPAWIALYALAYAGVEDYEPALGLKPDVERFNACIDWLSNNLKQNQQGLWVWAYKFDSTYNDVSIKAPWSSAFGQATGIQALLASWKQTGNKTTLELARKAAESLFVPIEKGGLLFNSGDDIWFEEIPSSPHNPSHILNGHMRVLLALSELKEVTNSARYEEWLNRGLGTLLLWLPRYDTGYWFRYDLNPKKEKLLFRLANPYGFANPNVAIDRITLRDPVSGKESIIDLGVNGDVEGIQHIAGNDWEQPEIVDGHNVRRLLPSYGEKEAFQSSGQMVAPFSYFYFSLPGEWNDNLRTNGFELIVDYLDEKVGNLIVQLRSISPASETFKDLRNGELLLSGSGNWRQWKISLFPNDLGYWVGDTYAKKHVEYLKKLSLLNTSLKSWSNRSEVYLRMRGIYNSLMEVVVNKNIQLPSQSPMLPVFSLDDSGVVTQWRASDKTEYYDDGSYDPNSDPGKPVYSPFIIAQQALAPKSVGQGGYRNLDKDEVTSQAAIDWFLSSENQLQLDRDGITYSYNFENSYNDVVTPENWASAFSQAYILKALRAAYNKNKDASILRLIKKVANAYKVPVENDGISTIDDSGRYFFEEVPNATHVLNAHLVSISELYKTLSLFTKEDLTTIVEAGVQTLKSEIDKFDTGYWLRYDLNPKKEILFQIDWIDGKVSPLIDEIQLQAPQFNKTVKLKLGSDSDFSGGTRISGSEWLAVQSVDGRLVRGFNDGYKKHGQAVQGGTRHNVYVITEIPQRSFDDYFDIQPHQLVIRYKDVAPGHFGVKIQAINEGNFLDFVPLRDALITTVGDQKWKEVIIQVRQQDMGWFKGPDYQIFEIQQLEEIADFTGDWFFKQIVERQQYFLESKEKGLSVIVAPSFKNKEKKEIGLNVISSSSVYQNFDFSNALDDDPNDDYVAGKENLSDNYVILKANKTLKKGCLKILWESAVNHAGSISVSRVNPDMSVVKLKEITVNSGEPLKIEIDSEKAFNTIRLDFSMFAGQPRILLRLIELKEVELL